MKTINPTHFENIPAFPKDPQDDNSIFAVIETPSGLRNKYALDPKFGIFKLKSIISDGLSWPYDYGFIPQTLGDDGDPLDVLFLSDEPTFPGCLVEARLLGIIRLRKNGEENDRLIACALRQEGTAQSTDDLKDIEDLPPELTTSIVRFLTEYSEEQENKVEYLGVRSQKRAYKAVKAGVKEFNKKHKPRSNGKKKN